MQLIQYSLLTTLLPVATARNNIRAGRRLPIKYTQENIPLPASGKFVTDLSKCPPLARRVDPPKDIHGLRPDDFSVAMAIGDSITAGAFAKGIDPSDKFLNWVDWRGVSYAGGADDGAVTVPNILKHYNSNLIGGARGYNPGYELCFGSGCPVGPVGWNSTVDMLNARQSGAYASNLLHEAQDYLVPQVKALNISDDKYKYLSFQVGANDVCQLCAAADMPMGPSTRGDFEQNVRAALEHIRGNIHSALQRIVKDYKSKNYKNFAVIYQPPNLPFKDYPIEVVNSVDCFHPSTAGHERIAAGLWNRLTLNATSRAAPFTWEETPQFRCLDETDRIQT
ncbi:carbohydrate esterase family 16 protein [Ceratobasidium sp. AG-Ba]|nr:carbohydrate esterase family 16 protein [Ceratobasidium sp. AG-Ba]